MPAPIIEHRVGPAPSVESALRHLETVSTKGAYDCTPDLEFWIIAFHHDPEQVPASVIEDVIDEETRRCSDEVTGFAYFLRWYGLVRIKGGKFRGWQKICVDGVPRVDPATGNDWGWQLLLAEIYPVYDQLLILKARQLGMTFLTANYILWKMIFFPGTAVGVVMNVLPNAKRLVNRVRETYWRYPMWIKDLATVKSDSVMLFTFENGSSVEPSKEARSEALGLLVLDEFAHIKPAIRQEEIWASAEACADNGGQIIVHDTALGVGNLFHSWCMDSYLGEVEHRIILPRNDGTELELEAMVGDAGMGFVFLPYWLEPHRDFDWMQAKRKRYRGSLHMLQQEYPDTVEQAFISSGVNFFDIVSVEQQALDARKVYEERDVRVSLLWADREKHTVKPVEDPNGCCVIHGMKDLADALKSDRPFVIGADAAGDEPTGDFHAASGLHLGLPYKDTLETLLAPPDSMVKHKQLVTIHGQMPAEQYAENLEKLGYLLHRAVIAVEANGVGSGVITNLKRKRYPRLYVRRNKTTSTHEKRTTQIGWWSSSETKNYAAGTLDKWLRADVIEIRDLETLEEMRGVHHRGNGRLGAEAPRHDDRPSGLWIACAVAQSAAARMVADEVEDPDDPILEILAEIARENEGFDVLLGNEMACAR
jgi:hypothetical protein